MVRLEEWLSNDRTRLTAPPPRTPHFNACLKGFNQFSDRPSSCSFIVKKENTGA